MSNVKVVVRIRPQNEVEKQSGGKRCCSVYDDNCGISLTSHPEPFVFDHVFDINSSQQEVYQLTAKSIVEDILAGYNGTVFAYGQTGSGKTFTMTGPDVDNEALKGVIPRIIHDIFKYMEFAPESIEFTVKVSFVEIYLEKIRDLFNAEKVNLQVHEDSQRGIYVKNATEVYVGSVNEMLDAMKNGSKNRKVASTRMNNESSRSHSIFMITLQQKDTSNNSVKTGKLYLVDLAGSEKVLKTEAVGLTLDEAKTINKSLSALGNVITSLTDGKSSHVPYRDSKLTRILAESLGGNARTTVIIAASPSSYNEAETLSSLRFGARAKNIKNKAKVNQELTVAQLTKLLNEAKKNISLMKQELEIWRSGGTPDLDKLVSVSSEPSSLPPSPKLKPSPSPSKDKDELLRRENELVDLVSEKQNEIDELKESLETAIENQASFEVLQKDNAGLHEQLLLVQHEKDQVIESYKEQTINMESLSERNVTYQAELKREKEKSDSLKRERELNNAASEEKHRQEKKFYMKENSSLKETVEESQSKIESLEEEVSGLLEQLIEHEEASIESSNQESAVGQALKAIESQMVNKEVHEKIVVSLKAENDTLKKKTGRLQIDLDRQTHLAKSVVSRRQDVEKTVDKLTRVLEQLVVQNNQLKLEQSVFERKLKQKSDRIVNLENRVIEIEQQNTREELEHKFLITRYENEIAALKKDRRQSRLHPADENPVEHETKIVKIIKGHGPDSNNTSISNAEGVSSPSAFWRKKFLS